MQNELGSACCLFVQDPSSGRIRITRAGIKRYGEKFARAGFDIRRIRTLEAFEAAVDASFACEMQALASTAKGEDPELGRILAGLPGWD